MKNFKSLSVLFEQGPPDPSKFKSSSSGRPANNSGSGNRNSGGNAGGNTGGNTNPAAPAKITKDAYNKLVQELDGFALYFSKMAEAYIKYDESAMADCDGIIDDSESCYWNKVYEKMKMAGLPGDHSLFVKKVEEFNKLITDNKIPDDPGIEHAKLVKERILHNVHEARRMVEPTKNRITDNVPSGARTDTARGMVYKALNYDDHNFRWTMYYTYSPVTPYKGGTAEAVSQSVSKEVDCDF